jgi:hypothetical protein
MTPEELVKRIRELVNESALQDSIEIGTPSKGGAVKLYLNMADIEASKKKIDAAKTLRDYMQGELSV